MQDKPIRAIVAIIAVLMICGCMKAYSAVGEFLMPEARLAAAY